MGILTDFVIAESGAGQAIGDTFDPSATWPTFQAKSLDTIKLASLCCAIEGKPYDTDIEASFQLVGGDKEEGPWVFEFSADVLRALAAIEKERVREIADVWAQSEELQFDHWSADDAAWAVEGIAEHARKAVEAGKSMYLWLSL